VVGLRLEGSLAVLYFCYVIKSQERRADRGNWCRYVAKCIFDTGRTINELKDQGLRLTMPAKSEL